MGGAAIRNNLSGCTTRLTSIFGGLSFTTDPTGGDTDLRLTYCAFVISTLLDDWSGVDVEKAVHFVRRCRASIPFPSRVPKKKNFVDV